jgi:hypothetical protein
VHFINSSYPELTTVQIRTMKEKKNVRKRKMSKKRRRRERRYEIGEMREKVRRLE